MPSSAKLYAVILAAGKGTRMKSEMPKVLHRICGLTLLERTVRAVQSAGATEIVIVVGHGQSLVEQELQHLKNNSITSVIQKEQRGTGHAAQVAIAAIKDLSGAVLIVPGDVPLLKPSSLTKLFQTFNENNTDITVLTCTHPTPKGYGRVVRDKQGHVAKIVEDRDCNADEAKISEINTGIYLVKASFLAEALPSLKPQNAQGEYYLTDIISFARGKNARVEAVTLTDHNEVSGVNNRYELSILEKIRRRELSHEHMLNGVTFEDPRRTYIDETVTIESDCFIGAGVRLTGNTKILTRSVVNGPTTIDNSAIGPAALIKEFTSIESSTVGAHCQVGPFAHLRPDTVLDEKVKIGNFVETKKTFLGRGAKANHLTYLGDAEIGTNANIGAGTITCNYDGINKHHTIIGENAFIGSNTSIVAPVTIGAGAVTGAGSVITKNVPADALAVERSDQTNIDGWAARRRSKQPKRGGH